MLNEDEDEGLFDLSSVAPALDQLKDLTAMVKHARELQDKIDFHENGGKAARAEMHYLVTRTIPEAMAAAGTAEFRTDDGLKVSVRDVVAGSLPKDPDAHAAALDWLENNQAGDLIKGMVSAEFRRGEDNALGNLVGHLREMGIEFSSKRSVHASTLAAFARERLRKAEEVPFELLGLYAGRMAKIEGP